MKKYFLTIAITRTRGYEIEAATEEEARTKAQELLEHAVENPAELENAGEEWDYALVDEADGSDVIPWRN